MPLPRVDGALWGLGTKMSFSVITKALTDYENDEDVGEQINFFGVLSPMDPEKLEIKQEGQRSWKRWILWTRQELKTDWQVEDSLGRIYRVLPLYDYGSAGYRKYGLVETYSD